MKKKTVRWIIVLAVVFIAILLYFGSKSNKDFINVTTEKVTKRDIIEMIPANGKIKPVVEVKISPDVSGEIVELYFKEGDQIKRGDLIIKIKQDVYISMKDRAEASLNSVKAQLTQQQAQFVQTEQTYQRNKALYEQRVISESEYEASLAQYAVAQEQIRAAEFNVKSSLAALKEAEENLIKTTIYAPMDGIISKMSVEKGERVVGTSQMAGTEMLRIADLDDMEVLVDVNENDIVRVNQGDTTTIEVDAYPNRKFTGVVTQIANSAKNIGSSLDQVTNFEVKVYILPDSYSDIVGKDRIPFRPGMSASVSIQTAKRINVISIPLQSITTRTDLIPDSLRTQMGANESREQVFVVKSDQTIEVRNVTTGIQDLSNIEILSGLSDQDEIVIGPFSAISKTLKSGTKVSSATDSSASKASSPETTN